MTADLSGRPPIFPGSSNAFVALAGKARRTSDTKLVVSEAIGFFAAVAVVALAPRRWELALPAVSIGAFGLWGITDHMIGANRERLTTVVRLPLLAFRFAVAAVGIAAAIAFGFALLGFLMGTWVL